MLYIHGRSSWQEIWGAEGSLWNGTAPFTLRTHYLSSVIKTFQMPPLVLTPSPLSWLFLLYNLTPVHGALWGGSPVTGRICDSFPDEIGTLGYLGRYLCCLDIHKHEPHPRIIFEFLGSGSVIDTKLVLGNVWQMKWMNKCMTLVIWETTGPDGAGWDLVITVINIYWPLAMSQEGCWALFLLYPFLPQHTLWGRFCPLYVWGE